MATYYVGPRPVIKGRDTVNMVNPYKGTAGTYSYYPLFATSHALDGAPDNNHVPGTGYRDRKSTRLNSSHVSESRMPSSA